MIKQYITIICFLSLVPGNILAKNDGPYIINDNIVFTDIQALPEYYEMKIYARSNDTYVNAAQVQIVLPMKDLLFIDIEIDNPLCELVIEDNFDSDTGLYSLVCGKPTPGINGQFVLAKIRFKPSHEGFYRFIFLDNMLLANDGLGTNILQASYDHCPYLHAM